MGFQPFSVRANIVVFWSVDFAGCICGSFDALLHGQLPGGGVCARGREGLEEGNTRARGRTKVAHLKERKGVARRYRSGIEEIA